MSDKFSPIPIRSEVIESGNFLSRAWHQFLYKIFYDIFTRIESLETTSTDHETRIDALENP